MANNSQNGSRKTVVIIVLSVLALGVAGYSVSSYLSSKDYNPKTASVPDPESAKLKLPDTPPPGLGGPKPDRGHSTLGK